MDQEGQRVVERISQATIEIHVENTNDDFIKVRNIVLSWLARKAGASLPDSMQRGETAESNAIGIQRVETAAISDPLYWTARQDAQDANSPRRMWITEATLAQSQQDRLLVGHRLHCVTLGEPSPFSRSIPRFMRDIARRFPTYLDGAQVGLTAHHARTEEDIEDLVQLLLDGKRRHPVIGISTDPQHLGGSPWLIDPDRLANEIFGVAHVWLIHPEAAFALSDRVGRELSVFHGGVRSWRIPMTLSDSGFAHPLATSRRITALGEAGVISFHRELVDWALRFSAGRRDADHAVPPFSEVRRLAARLTRDHAASQGRSERELLQLALDENEHLNRELAEQKELNDETLKVAEEDSAQFQAERDEALREAARLRARIAALETALRAQRKEIEAAIPDNLSELSEWSELHLDNRVTILPRAIQMAKKSPFEDVSLVYNTLLALRDKYVAMRRTGTSEAKNDCDEVWRGLGLELTPSFAGAGAGQFGDDYRVKWNGVNRNLDMHLKGSSSRDPRYGFRCYFFWDERNKAVVVGAIPGHLTTNAT